MTPSQNKLDKSTWLEECVSKILNESKTYKVVYAREECYGCDGYNKKCADYFPIEELPT